MADLQMNDQGNGVIALVGSLNRKTVVGVWPNHQQILDDFKQRDVAVTLDLEAVEHVDTAGLAWLLDLFAERYKIDQKLALINTPVSLLKIAKISNVESILPLQ